RELVERVRAEIGPVAALKRIVVVDRLPKTRSGKILRGTMRAIADGRPWTPPATIEDAAVLDESGAAPGSAPPRAAGDGAAPPGGRGRGCRGARVSGGAARGGRAGRAGGWPGSRGGGRRRAGSGAGRGA